MINKVVISGRTVKSPDLRYTGSGKAVCNMTIACQRNFKNKEGEYEADFIKVVIWGKLAELAAKHLDKGSLVNVSGRLQIRKSKSEKDGRTYINPEIVANEIDFLDWFTGDKKKNQSSNNQNENSNQNNNGNVDEESFDEDDFDENIPF
jgi:single-strand DNA-binding protein